MRAFVCRTCGVQYAPTHEPPARCIICEDERQYIGRGGQRWTTLDELSGEGYANAIVELEPGLHSIRTSPQFAIGQRALLVQTPSGNALWDCITLLDEATIARVRGARRHPRDRYLPSALLRDEHRVGAGVRRDALHPGGRQGLGDVSRGSRCLLGGQHRGRAGGHPGPVRRALRGERRDALGSGSRRPGRAAHRRYLLRLDRQGMVVSRVDWG